MFKKPEPKDILLIARETFVTDILPFLPNEKRYTAAMIANAMAICRRQISGTEPCAERALLDAVYGKESKKTFAEFASDLRSGTISEITHPALPDQMMAALRIELTVSNPKFRE